jgi:molecular chaperone GrpE
VLTPDRKERVEIMPTRPRDPADDRVPNPDEQRDETAPAGDSTRSDERAAIADACRERDEYRDLLLRKTAEFDNYRKRVERERREQAAFEVMELLGSLLPVLDDFERALKIDAVDNPEAYRAGIELIHRQLVDVLERRGVKAIDALGADFDPHVHQAVVTEASPSHRDGEVIEELRRGYRLGERLLRPAMVKVAKA